MNHRWKNLTTNGQHSEIADMNSLYEMTVRVYYQESTISSL